LDKKVAQKQLKHSKKNREMTSVLKQFNNFRDHHGDERTKHLFLMDHPFLVAGICLVYVYLTKLGPRLMENRKPFRLNHIMTLYNFAQVILNAWLFREFLFNGWLHYNLRCQPNDPVKNEKNLRMAQACHLFFLSKFFDLFDSLFFVLRKKNSQISGLHVFHHASVLISCKLKIFSL
jgi:elongation of very long chain fatty acids protein 7